MTKSLAVITGASSGIGAMFARKLVPGHDLLLIARRKDRLDELAHQLASQSGSNVSVLQADLTNEAELATVAGRIASLERLAVLVNNAGFGTKGMFWEADIEGQMQMHRLHVMAVVRLAHAALRNMVPKNSGAIINVASVGAFLRVCGNAGYAATKSWMTAFTEGLYVELQSAGSAVRVQALCPGFTSTEFHDTMKLDRKAMTPASLWMQPEFVVDQSLRGLRRGKLIVVPGWRYKAMVTLLSKAPTPLRLALEKASSRSMENAPASRGPA